MAKRRTDVPETIKVAKHRGDMVGVLTDMLDRVERNEISSVACFSIERRTKCTMVSFVGLESYAEKLGAIEMVKEGLQHRARAPQDDDED